MTYSQKEEHRTPVDLKYMHTSTTMGSRVLLPDGVMKLKEIILSMRKNRGKETGPQNALRITTELKFSGAKCPIVLPQKQADNTTVEQWGNW
jgi:hypothetical protein